MNHLSEGKGSMGTHFPAPVMMQTLPCSRRVADIVNRFRKEVLKRRGRKEILSLAPLVLAIRG